MLYKPLFRRALALHISSTFRPFSASPFVSAAMAQPPQTFSLDRSIFNETLYTRMRDFWFADLPEGASAPPPELAKTWWGLISAEEKDRFDGRCTQEFGHALEALTPDKLVLPEFKSYEEDIKHAEEISKPFFEEVKETQKVDGKKGTDTLLSFMLILDQMTRNIYRDPAGLPLVFNHFDRLAFALFHASQRLDPSPIEHEAYRLRPVVKNWFLMPLMHAEHNPSHDLWTEITLRWRKEVEAVGDEKAVEGIDQGLKAEDKHREPLKRFGRYPHRNEALGRVSSKEEEEFLKTGETFGVKQREGGGNKEKDEL